MKIAIITEGFSPFVGGVETRYTELAMRLAREHEVCVYTILQKEVASFHVPKVEKVNGVEICRVPCEGEYFLPDGTRPLRGLASFLVKIFSKIRGGSFDAVICSEWPLVHVVPIAAFKSSCFVVDWHEVWGRYYFNFGLKGRLGYLLERAVTRMPGLRHVAVSNFTRDRLTSILGVSRDKIPVIPSGVDVNAFDSINAEREWGRLVYFGRFMPHKHVEWLIEAYKWLMSQGYELSLRIMGDGPLRGSIEERVKGLPRAELLPPLAKEELIRELKKAWVAAIPSTREGQGISYLEAMAAGTPVVAVDSPFSAAKELIKSGFNGLLVGPSPSGLARGIKALLEDEKLWLVVSGEGCKTALEYSWEESATKYSELLEDGVRSKG